MSALRRAAQALTRHAAGVMPAERAEWGRAMLAETDHIGDDAAALRWALGCVWSAYLERIAMSRTASLAVRLTAAWLIAMYALIELPIVLMVTGYKLGDTGMAAAMDGAAPGDDYTRFTALMDQMTPWHVAGGFAQLALFLAAAMLLAFGRARAVWLFGAAMAVTLAGKFAVRALPASADAMRGTAVQDVVILGVLALVGGAAFWLAARRPGTPAA